MKAQDYRYTRLLNSAVQFVIPVFQRDYRWSEDQCSQLWEDVYEAGKENDPHFFGPVVYIASGDVGAAFAKWLLIDGQQRITTVTLLLAALADHANNLGQKKLSKQIKNYFLVNSEEDDDRRWKLVLRERDEATLRWIVNGERKPSDISPPIKQNYDFFRSKLHDLDINMTNRIYGGIGQLVIVDTRLDRHIDDPQKIFESLNSTGIDLTQSDLVRNYILMGLPEKEQAKLYGKYWRDMEEFYSGTDSQFDNFLRDFIALETQSQKQGRIDEVYRTFQSIFKEHKHDAERLEELLVRMRRLAQFHSALVVGRKDIHGTKAHLSRLRSLATTSAILVVQLLDAREDKYISQEDLFKALDLIEGYIVRRAVCGSQTRSYWKQFAELAYCLKEEKTSILDLLKANINNLSHSYAFPKDGAFKRALLEQELYGRPICRYLLDRLENAHSEEKTDTSSYTIEHIMPQEMTKEWKVMLGTDWKNVQETWLHRLGNLTLTAYNQKYSNQSFTRKIEMDDGFASSPLRLNKYVGSKKSWTEKELKKRAKVLTQRALRIWSDLNVSDAALQHAKQRNLERKASQQDIDVVLSNFDENAHKLFRRLQAKIIDLQDDIIELGLQKSVSYHIPEFVCEVVPRKGYILVLLNIDYDDVSDSSVTVSDSSQRRSLQNARHDAGSFLEIHSKEDIGHAMPLLRRVVATLND